MDWIKLKALEYGLALLVAPLAMVTVQGLKLGVRQVDALPAWQKRGVVLAVAALFTALGNLAGVNFGVTPESVEGLATVPAATIETVLAALIAMALHWIKNKRKQDTIVDE